VLGVPVPSGRVQGAQRAALREVVERWRPELRLTCRQDVLLTGVAAGHRAAVDAVFAAHGVALVDAPRPLDRYAMACPALPTCGQALSESERIMPRIVADLGQALDAAGLGDLPVRLNMTGCPNGCARPYTSEIGIVGRTKSTYDLYVGGAVGGQRLNRRIAIGAKLDEMPKLLGRSSGYRVEAADGGASATSAARPGPGAPVWAAPARAPAHRSTRTDARPFSPTSPAVRCWSSATATAPKHKAPCADAGADVTRRHRRTARGPRYWL
jgi:sulfite reductase (ferredoxin)